MTTKVSIAQCRNAANHDRAVGIALSSLQADVQAICTAMAALTAMMDANLLAGHPYTIAANNPSPNTTP